MNAVSFLRGIETLGAKEFRQRLDKMLRFQTMPCRVMLHNKPALAVLPDDFFLQIMEVLEEIKDEGIMDRVLKKLEAERKDRHAWFWSKSWQKKEREADKEIRAGRTHRAHSADELIRQLES